MTDVVHMTGEGGRFGSTALCGADTEVAGNLWLTALENCVTCVVCQGLYGGAA